MVYDLITEMFFRALGSRTNYFERFFLLFYKNIILYFILNKAIFVVHFKQLNSELNHSNYFTTINLSLSLKISLCIKYYKS